MLIQDTHDSNLLVVAAVEEYARRHEISTKETIDIFREHNIFFAIRSQYEVLHMLDLDEAASFADDLLVKRSKEL